MSLRKNNYIKKISDKQKVADLQFILKYKPVNDWWTSIF